MIRPAKNGPGQSTAVISLSTVLVFRLAELAEPVNRQAFGQVQVRVNLRKQCAANKCNGTQGANKDNEISKLHGKG
jgi:hypothetical protein